MRLTLGLAVLLLAGCASDQTELVRAFHPTEVRDGYQYFRAVIRCSHTMYPEGSEFGERARRRWLSDLLKDNGWNPAELEIVDRMPLMMAKGPWKGSGWQDIHYTVRVPDVAK